MIATGYLRRSKKSDDNTVSLYEQERQIQAYCADKGFSLASIVTHNGISGGKRSRFEDIHKAIALSNSKALVIYNQDRLARDAAGLLDNLRLLAAAGVAVHDISSGIIDLKKSSAKLSVAVRASVDEFFKDVISEKTADALRYLRQKGQRYSNHAPFGFSYVQGVIVPDIEEQKALSIIAECRINGLGARRTRKALLRSGYKGRIGVATLHRLLHSPPPEDIADKLPASYFALPRA